MTYEGLQQSLFEQEESGRLTSLPAASPARTSAWPATVPESDSELTARVPGYGQKCTESFANYDPDTHSWRTSQICLNGEWAGFSQTWPRAGTMQSGRCYPQPSLAYPIYGKDSFLLPTPQYSDWKGGSLNGRDSELKHFLRRRFGGSYPAPTFVERLMGFPSGWGELEGQETP